jgi:hypothetical protein
MDDIVLQAMLKWPNVPHCCGWLGLDGRGDWYMRDDQAQAAGPFTGVADDPDRSRVCKGSRLQHDKLIGFIGRNYASDPHGQWYFQNGPQRVYVELTHAPWVWRLTPGTQHGTVMSHTGRPAQVISAVTDEEGQVYLHTSLGFGLVHTQDMALAADALLADQWPLTTVARCELPTQYGYVLSPEAAGWVVR